MFDQWENSKCAPHRNQYIKRIINMLHEYNQRGCVYSVGMKEKECYITCTCTEAK